MKTILAADIGGTNSRFALFQLDPARGLSLLESKWLSTSQARSFPHLLELLRGSGLALPEDGADVAVLGIAGPVEQGTRCAPPYISWTIDLARDGLGGLARRSQLVNDFVAQAYACRSPIAEHALGVHPGTSDPEGVIGVLGAGTALGKALLVPVAGQGFLALPSEGGHNHFPFLTEEENEFRRFYEAQSGVSEITENLMVSGGALRYLHWFHTGQDLEPHEAAARFTPESETLAWAARFYGRVCRNFALDVLATGGLYVTGGVAAKNPAIVTHPEFLREFLASHTMGRVLAGIPIALVCDEQSGLWGAAYCGEQLLRKG